MLYTESDNGCFLWWYIIVSMINHTVHCIIIKGGKFILHQQDIRIIDILCILFVVIKIILINVKL